MSQAAVRYRIAPVQPGAHLFEVTLEIADPAPEGQQLWLPAWIPGSYMIRDFARNIVTLEATSAGQAVAVDKLDKQTWQCAPCQGPLRVRYEVYAWDLSVRGAHLDTTHGYFNGTSVFLAVKGREDEPCGVEIVAPAGEAYAHWRVATSLPRDGAGEYAFGTYLAADYDELIDHPVEMGDFALATFEANGVPHDIAIYGRQQADLTRITADLKKICELHLDFFGQPVPMKRYLFMVIAVGSGYGGLEHRSSTSLMCSRNDLPLPGEKEISEGYRNFLGLCSHEYFHTWNVKRIKPARFMPYALAAESHTRLLWVFEGFTSYYDDLSLARSGLVKPKVYLEALAQTITRVLRGAGRLKQSISESSFDAWTKFYKQDENAPNAIVSYYTKGALVALALDLTLRRESKGLKNLDDVMRLLWRRYGEQGVGVGEGAMAEIIEEATGVDCREFIARYVDGREDPPLADLLVDVGVGVDFRAAEGQNDKGGTPARRSASQRERAVDLGLRLGGLAEATVTHVLDDGAAQAAGIAAGDVLLALDGLRVSQSELEMRLKAYAPGDVVEVHLFRRDELMSFQLTLKAPPQDTCYLTLKEKIPEDVAKRRRDWLGGA